jgi:predicted small lipoprotein YifL
MQLNRKALLAGVAGASLLAGCGQTGALYLPDEGVTTPVEIRPAPAAAPATAPTAAAEDKQEDAKTGDKTPEQG